MPCWHYVLSADLLSRGTTIKQLEKSYGGKAWDGLHLQASASTTKYVQRGCNRKKNCGNNFLYPSEVLINTLRILGYSVSSPFERFIAKLKGSRRDRSLSVEEIKEAETTILRRFKETFLLKRSKKRSSR